MGSLKRWRRRLAASAASPSATAIWTGRGGAYTSFSRWGEARSDTGDGMRVVRVGTDALKPNAGATLWGRLRQHRGSLKTGGGNHRASIFRLLVGTAIGRIWGDNSPITWGVGGSASEAARTMHCRFSIATSHVTGLTPPRHRGASGNLRPFVGGQLLRSCSPALSPPSLPSATAAGFF
jgi:hypothetical protein